MRQLLDINDQENYLQHHLMDLDKVNKKIAQLMLKKEQLTEKVITVLGHKHEGQKTYEYNIWRIEVKTPCVYSLNKKMYESGNFNIPEEYNPIRKSISYSIDKKLCDKYINDAPKNVRNALTKLIEKKPGKSGIVLKERLS